MKKFTLEQRQLIELYASQHISSEIIARIMRVSPNRIAFELERNEKPYNAIKANENEYKRFEFTFVDRQKLEELLSQGLKTTALARHFKIGLNCILTEIKKGGDGAYSAVIAEETEKKRKTKMGEIGRKNLNDYKTKMLLKKNEVKND